MMIQAAVGANTIAGIALGQDIETGFLNRIALTPVRGAALVAAGLAGVAVLGTMQTAWYWGWGWPPARAWRRASPAAFAVIGVVLLDGPRLRRDRPVHRPAIGWRGGGSLLVLAHPGPALHVLDVHAAEPHDGRSGSRPIATYNPISYLIEAPRSLFITGWDAEALALGCGIAVIAVLIIAVLASAAALSGRVVRG